MKSKSLHGHRPARKPTALQRAVTRALAIRPRQLPPHDPPRPTNARHVLPIRFSWPEYSEVASAAANAGKPPSTYIRDSATNAAQADNATRQKRK